MRRVLKILLVVIGIYVLALAGCGVWLAPSLVNDRVGRKVKPGVSGEQVAVALGIHGPMDIPEAKHCAPTSNERFTRISIYDAGSVPLIPFLMVYATSTIFCFDSQDRLVTFNTRRWVDAP
jgi:predicted small lipoprotein YifL